MTLSQLYKRHQPNPEVYGSFHLTMAHTYKRCLDDSRLREVDRMAITRAIKSHKHTELIAPAEMKIEQSFNNIFPEI